MHQFATAAEGLEFEAQSFAADGPQVALWSCEAPALVCPQAYRKRPGFDAAVAASAARGWPVTLRRTGGGTVPLGPEVLNICLAFTRPNSFSIGDGYVLLTEVLRTGFGGAGGAALTPGATPGSYCDGDWNLSLQGRKVIGTAQRRRPLPGGQVRVLAHALIVTHGDVAPGALAVDAFHSDLGLPPILVEVHTSVAAVLGADRARHDRLAPALQTAGEAALAELD